jgi:hypothetical protein
MISFIRLPYRPARTVPSRTEIGPWATAVILALILCFQVGLLVWAFVAQWGG